MSTSGPVVQIQTTLNANAIQVHASDAAFVAAKGSGAAAGDVYVNSTDGMIHWYDGASGAWRVATSLDKAQTLTNKTLTSPTIATPAISDPTVSTGTFTNPLINGIRLATTAAKTSDYPLTTSDVVVPVDASGGNITITAPDCATNSGRIFIIKLTAAPGSNVVTLARSGPDTFEGLTSLKAGTLGDEIMIQSGGGTVWRILNYNVFNGVLSESNTARSISNNAATTGQFLMEDEIYDPLAQHSITTAIFAAQVPGKYRVGASVELASDANWTRNDYLQIQLFKNGTFNRTMGTLYAQVDNTLIMAIQGSTDVACAAGDTLEVRIFQNSGAAISTTGTAASNWVSYARIGN